MIKYTPSKMSDFFIPKNLGKINLNTSKKIIPINTQIRTPQNLIKGGIVQAGHTLGQNISKAPLAVPNLQKPIIPSNNSDQWLEILGVVIVIVVAILVVDELTKPEEEENKN